MKHCRVERAQNGFSSSRPDISYSCFKRRFALAFCLAVPLLSGFIWTGGIQPFLLL